MSSEEKSFIEGSISVKAVLEADTRHVFSLYVNKKKFDRNIGYIMRLAEKKRIPIEAVSPDFFEEKGFGKTHGGIVAEVGERRFIPYEDLFYCENPFIALLEGIEDPFNFGCAVRSLYAAGATGLILPERNWMSAAGTVIKSSAGASEMLKTAVCDDFTELFVKAKSAGIKTVCAERKDAVPLYGQELIGPLLIAVGGEKRGVSKLVFDNSDLKVFIPYGSEFRNSLSASAACAVLAFEINRQRNFIG